jgi:antitoxin (DNA-binding transcriptional repressor) of toxin-antitoxin stability system
MKYNQPIEDMTMRTIELHEATHCLPQLCEAVARTGETVIVLADQKPPVTLAPAVERTGTPVSVWAARRQSEHEQGALTEDFNLPPHTVDEATWRNPLDG